MAVPPVGLPGALTPVGMALNVAVSNPEALNAPYLLRLRYDGNAVANEDDLAVVYFNAVTSRYEPVTVLAHDKAADSFLVEARTFSAFVVVSYAATSLPASYTLPGFTPANSGWSITNAGSYHALGGNALGMAGFSAWYAGNRTGDLSTKFSPSVAPLVATHAQLAQGQYWAQKSNTYRGSLANAAKARLMKLSMALLDQPVILVLGNNGSAASAMVLYGYDSTGLRFYDPNVPGVAQTVTFDGTTLGNYGGFDSLSYVALPSLGRTDDFAQLTTEAEAGFASSSLINVGSPSPDQQVAARRITLDGTLSGSLATGASMLVYAKGLPQRVAASAGSFTATLPASAGSNTIVVVAGSDVGQQSNWHRNAAVQVLNVNSSVEATKLMTTLVWDQDGSDLDLYVSEPPPSTETAWYANSSTDKLLELHFEDTSGLGPEHTSLATLGAAPGTALPGLYRIRVHYYADRGAGPTVSGTVMVLVNEGQVNQQLTWRRFTLTAASSGNDSPGATGPDWADIATADLVNGVITVGP
jgi:uncharacterized protein YfaP (DUF2135 family)/phosphoheptose isomerase